jgi:hypothetical protein
MERHSSSSSNCRENVAGISAITLIKGNYLHLFCL